MKYVADMLLWQNCWFTKYVGGSESSGQNIASFTNSLSRGLKNSSGKTFKVKRYWNLAANTTGSICQQIAMVLFAKYLFIYILWVFLTKMPASIMKYKINFHDYLHVQGSLYCANCYLFKLPALFFYAAFVCRMQICRCCMATTRNPELTSVSMEWLWTRGRHKETISQGKV
jgi:hypothetical protein